MRKFESFWYSKRMISLNGVNKKVEIHWYEANGKRVEMKVKRYYNEG